MVWISRGVGSKDTHPACETSATEPRSTIGFYKCAGCMNISQTLSMTGQTASIVDGMGELSKNLKRRGPVIGMDGGPNVIIKSEIVEDQGLATYIGDQIRSLLSSLSAIVSESMTRI